MTTAIPHDKLHIYKGAAMQRDVFHPGEEVYLGEAHWAMASERQGASRTEHSGSTTSSGVSSVKSRNTVGVRNLALHTADASCTCEGAQVSVPPAWQHAFAACS